MSLLLYLDTESTGLDPKTCGATQISGIIVRGGKEISRLDINVNPYSYHREVTISPKALEVTRKSIKEIKGYPSATVGFYKLTSWLNAHRDLGEYFTLICYRTSYDLGILEELFKDQKGNSRGLYDFIQFKTLDILESTKLCSLIGVHKLKNEKLTTVCEYYNVPLIAHDSLEDIVASRKVYKKMLIAMGVAERKLKVI